MDIKKEIASRITKSRKAIGITIKELSARIGTLSAGRISNWEQGTRSPGPVEAMLLAKELDVSASYLLCLTADPQGELTSSSKNKTKFIPVLQNSDVPHAHEIIKAMDETTESEPVVDTKIAVDAFNSSFDSTLLFAIKVEDNSMEPEIKSGSVVIVDSEKPPQPGSYVVAFIKSKKQVVLRKYGEADGCEFQLLASNELWATVSVNNAEDVDICGVVTEVRNYI